MIMADSLLTLTVSLLVAVVGGFLLGRLSRNHRETVVVSANTVPPPAVPAYISRKSIPVFEATKDKIPLPKTVFAPKAAPAASASRRRLIVVSYRLPIICTKTDTGWDIVWDKSQASIATIPILSKEMNIVFVGYPDCFIPREEQDDFETLLEPFSCIPVFLDRDLHERFFDGFCKGILWPLFHYVMPTNSEPFSTRWDSFWQSYTTVNMLYSRKITLATEDDESDFIWIHNYHLLLVPSFIRKKLSRAKIGLFLHTPFPTSDVFRTLPGKTNILRGILCSDLVGFHTYDYVRHFLSACKRVLDLDFDALPGGALGVQYCGRSVSIRISHMGITTEPFFAMLNSDKVGQLQVDIRERCARRKIIIAVDEYDVVKGVLVKLLAYEQFLNDRPHWASALTMILLVTPSLNSRDEQEGIRSSVFKTTDQIKKRFDSKVIQVIEMESVDIELIIAHLSVSDVGLFTSFFDGLNIVPFEFTAAQDPADPGVLIISEFMGCSRSLNGIIRVNPLDLQEVEEALSHALTMSKSTRVAQHARRHKYVLANNFEHWVRGFITDLYEASKQSEGLNYVQVGWGSGVRLIGLKADFRHLQEADIITSYRYSKHRALLFDYDGTLSTNQFERPPDSLIRILSGLCDDPSNMVFIISGRERACLSDWFSSLPMLGIAAEKGVFIKWPGESGWEALPRLGDFSWMETTIDLMKSYSDRTDGAYIEIKESALVWHYENADPEYGRSQASELGKYIEKLLESSKSVDVVRYDLNRILEVKPRGINKGVTSRKILNKLVLDNHVPQFLLCIGDDRSDEDAFLALQSSFNIAKGKIYTVCVGIKPSNAHYYVHDSTEVLKILNSLGTVSSHRVSRSLSNHS